MKQTAVKVPPILLEGDLPAEAPKGEQPEKFTSGPPRGPGSPESAIAPLSETYGTGRLFLMASDPHCLYAHWDLTEQQQRHFGPRPPDQAALQVRIHRDDASGPVLKEVSVPGQCQHSFVNVPESGAKYVAELGVPGANGTWQRIALSEPVVTPSDKVGQPQPIRFATMSFAPELGAETKPPVFPPGVSPTAPPVEKPKPIPPPEERRFPLPTRPTPGRVWEPPLPELATESTEQPAALVPPAVYQQEVPPRALPMPVACPSASGEDWTYAQERALAELIGWSVLRHVGLSSADLVRIRGGELPSAGELASLQAAALPLPPSSAALLSPERLGFWFNLNAELVIYGATEPNAQVTIDGQPITLRCDGTFTCRFALPDGAYELSVTATSIHGDSRRADLAFSRASFYSGQVGAHPQDPVLNPPLVQSAREY